MYTNESDIFWPFTLPFLHAFQLWSDVFTNSLPTFSVKYVKVNQTNGQVILNFWQTILGMKCWSWLIYRRRSLYSFLFNKSTLVHIMAWCHQAPCHYMNQCWPRSLLPYGVTRSQWVRVNGFMCLEWDMGIGVNCLAVVLINKSYWSIPHLTWWLLFDHAVRIMSNIAGHW